ncbi:TetR/AcrR family transcriptional regulator C-terminal domain-containing protein [soil metagenome]
MRKLAAHLGFEVMSLYNHVANKRDLLEGMLDLVSGEVDLPDPATTDWKDGLRQVAIDAHALLLRHRWAGPISTNHFPGPNGWCRAETILGLLAAGGFAGHLRDLGYHAITLHVSGFTAQQIAYDYDDEFQHEMLHRVEREFPAAEHPLMADHIRYHLDPDHTPGDRPDEFRFVLDLILDGLERSRDAPPDTFAGN